MNTIRCNCTPPNHFSNGQKKRKWKHAINVSHCKITMSSPDRRRQQVGHKKVGYCGHVPYTVYFDRPEHIEATIHHGKTNLEKRYPSVPASSHSPVEMGCLSGDVEANTKDIAMLAKLSRPSSQLSGHASPALASTQKVDRTKISGYAGHKVSQHLYCGGNQGELKINESDKESMNVPKFDSLPRLPMMRGPQRRQPTGFDVFLSV